MTTQTQTTTEEEKPIKNDYLIQTKIIREKGEVKLYIKTCSEFEDYLKKTRTLSNSDNFCNTEITKEFYNNRIDGLSDASFYDSAVRDLITDNRLNFAILRLRGISSGVEIELKRLINKSDLNTILRNFIKQFRDFYKEFIQDYEINCILTYKNIIF